MEESISKSENFNQTFESKISDYFPIDNTKINSSHELQKRIEFDAIFIPTLGQRANLKNLIEALRSTCHNIIILGTHYSNCDFPNVTVFNFTEAEHLNFRDSLNSSKNPTLNEPKYYDLATKRNFALHYSRVHQFKKIGLIDDDILIEKDQVYKAANLLNIGSDMVGFYSLQFPDKSTIDLVESIILGNTLNVSLSGNCLFMNLSHVKGFFPYIYNEDWVFILSNVEQCKISGIGLVTQLPHRPWKDLSRVKFEQFGDVFAFGLVKQRRLQEQGFCSALSFWDEVLSRYKERLHKLLELSTDKTEIYEVLKVASVVVATYTPQDFVSFVTNYYNEVNTWKYENNSTPQRL